MVKFTCHVPVSQAFHAPFFCYTTSPLAKVLIFGCVFFDIMYIVCLYKAFKKEGRRPWTINNEKYGEIPENVVLPDEGRVVIK